MREALAEFLGTFVLILFGVGVVAQVTLIGIDLTGIVAHLAGGPALP